MLITGSGAGTGKVTINKLVQRGVQNIAVAGRRKEQMEALKAMSSVSFFLCNYKHPRLAVTCFLQSRRTSPTGGAVEKKKEELL